MGRKASLRLVGRENLHKELPNAPLATPLSAMSDIQRESYYRMVRHYRRGWGKPMQLLIDQAVFGLAGVEQLEDAALKQLLADLERGIECIRDDVTFEDAGLLRTLRD
jgi:hypothetical protein